MRLGQLAFANLLIFAGLLVGITSAAGADCNIPFVPPARSPYYCTSSTPEQLEECRQQANQVYNEQVASSRQEWQRRQRQCQYEEQQRIEQQQVADHAVAEKRKQAQEALKTEELRLEVAKLRAEERPYSSNNRPPTHEETGQSKSASNSAPTVIATFFVMLLAVVFQWLRTGLPVTDKWLAILITAGVQAVVYLAFGIDLHDLVVTMLTLGGVPLVSLTLSINIGHAST